MIKCVIKFQEIFIYASSLKYLRFETSFELAPFLLHIQRHLWDTNPTVGLKIKNCFNVLINFKWCGMWNFKILNLNQNGNGILKSISKFLNANLKCKQPFPVFFFYFQQT